jgi:hypothetical protein
MNDETKEILIAVVDYYNAMGTENDPGIRAFESVVQRASKVLENHTKDIREDNKNNSSDVDPFSITGEFPAYKLEDEW